MMQRLSNTDVVNELQIPDESTSGRHSPHWPLLNSTNNIWMWCTVLPIISLSHAHNPADATFNLENKINNSMWRIKTVNNNNYYYYFWLVNIWSLSQSYFRLRRVPMASFWSPLQFYRPDGQPITKPEVSKWWRNIHHDRKKTVCSILGI